MMVKILKIIFIFVAFAIIVLFIVVAQLTCFFKEQKGELTIINRSESLIEFASVEVCRQRFDAQNIRKNTPWKIKFEVSDESDYNIIAKLSTGKVIRKRIGYITHSHDYYHVIMISNDDIFVDTERSKIVSHYNKNTGGCL